MSDCEIISVPTGFLIAAKEYGSLSASFSAIKCIRSLLEEGEIKAISLQLDLNIQPLLDNVYQTRKLLTPVCEGDPLIGKKDSEFCIYSRKDMAFLFFVVNYALKKRILSYAIEDFTVSPEKRLTKTLSQLCSLYALHGEFAHVCSESQAKELKIAL